MNICIADLRFYNEYKDMVNAKTLNEKAGLGPVEVTPDLLDILELKGRVITCPEWDSIEMDLSVIPTTNPAAALNFRLDGRSSHILLTTPLLANLPELFNNEALMEFCQKTYSHLGIPLPWLALLYPYTADWAFWELRKAWNN